MPVWRERKNCEEDTKRTKRKKNTKEEKMSEILLKSFFPGFSLWVLHYPGVLFVFIFIASF